MAVEVIVVSIIALVAIVDEVMFGLDSVVEVVVVYLHIELWQ